MWLASVLSPVIALALQPRCPGCGVVVDADHRFCGGCWSRLRFPGDPSCAGCGVPFDYDRGAGTRCGGCLAKPPLHAGIRAAVAYGPVARDVALKLKYGGRLAVAETMAHLMLRHVPPMVDRIVPVPLHRRRIWTRGYNQAALIGDAIARRLEIPIEKHALVRIRSTPPLREMGPQARARTVRGAFRVIDPDAVAGRSIVLVDDVHTSGATTDACVRELMRAGAIRVHILCWARVVGDDRDD